ncbi:MAG TPA: hypothetical protein VF459_19980, partial [Caulobacteraceae bacterium]
MTALPDPSDLAPSQDPAAYGRRRMFSVGFWAMISLCLLCILAGAAVVGFAPMLTGAAPPAAKLATPSSAGAPTETTAQTQTAQAPS